MIAAHERRGVGHGLAAVVPDVGEGRAARHGNVVGVTHRVLDVVAVRGLGDAGPVAAVVHAGQAAAAARQSPLHAVQREQHVPSGHSSQQRRWAPPRDVRGVAPDDLLRRACPSNEGADLPWPQAAVSGCRHRCLRRQDTRGAPSGLAAGLQASAGDIWPRAPLQTRHPQPRCVLSYSLRRIHPLTFPFPFPFAFPQPNKPETPAPRQKPARAPDEER